MGLANCSCGAMGHGKEENENKSNGSRERSNGPIAHYAQQKVALARDVDEAAVATTEQQAPGPQLFDSTGISNSTKGIGRLCGENCYSTSIRTRRGRGDGYDAIVIGSGYGGSVAACRLAQAGLKVCILEKGRRWEAPNFPDSFWQSLKTTSFNTPFGTLGQESALYQVHVDGSCMAVTAAGVGGGSLISAGVMVRTPKRTSKDPRWPKEWEDDWSTYESLSRDMLEPESVPQTFPKKKMMDAIATEELEDVEDSSSNANSIKIGIHFNEVINKAGVRQGPCVACGNCIVGCNYNAKASTDKNYLAAALQAGAHVRTESKVLFIAENPKDLVADWLKCGPGASACNCRMWRTYGRQLYDPAEEKKALSKNAAVSAGRRWRVYLNEVSFLTADIVILGAGVLGTNEILLRSRQRGLRLSERLGRGVSFNGNNIGFTSGSPAPLQGYGIDSSLFASTPVSQRPGPSICNSYTSSAGYTIQAAVYPKNLPYLVLRVWTYACDKEALWTVPSALWAQLKVWARTKCSSFMVLNMIGYDESDGEITLDRDTDRLRFVAPHDPKMVKKISACQKLAKRLRSRLYVSRFRSTAVHLLGGCGAAHDPGHGVTNPDGQVFDPKAASPPGPPHSGTGVHSDPGLEKTLPKSGSCGVHPGLFVSDGSLLPCAVGVNPSATITTLAERVAAAAVRYAYGRRDLSHGESSCECSSGRDHHLISRSKHLWMPRENSNEIMFPPQSGHTSPQGCSTQPIRTEWEDGDTPPKPRISVCLSRINNTTGEVPTGWYTISKAWPAEE